jgi:hypothetical protein
MRGFRELVDAAIEARRPLDTAEFARLAGEASPADRRYWQAQVRLDSAIADWRDAEKAGVVRRRSRTAANVVGAGALAAWRTFGTPRTAAALALGLSATFLLWPKASAPVIETVAVSIEPEHSAASSRPVRPAPVPAPQPPAPGTTRGPNDTLAMAQDKRFEEATATAERLAYAFQPVGEQVGTVVRFLIDAVPGSDVFSM